MLALLRPRRRLRRYRLNRCLAYLRRFARRFAAEVSPIDADTETRSVGSVEELRFVAWLLDSCLERYHETYAHDALPALRARWAGLDEDSRARLRAWREAYASFMQDYIEFRRSRYLDFLGPTLHQVPMPLPMQPAGGIL